MPDLISVDHDPFAAPTDMIPVNHDPFEDDLQLQRITPVPMAQDVIPAYASKLAETLAQPIAKTYYSSTPMEALQNTTEALLGMAGPLPVKGAGLGLAAAAPFALKAARAVEPEIAPVAEQGIQQGIRAFHGSPYDFEKFDLSRIGTGEGAQAYGHGLYFAENPEVAQSYKGTVPNGLAPWNPANLWTPAELPSGKGKMYEVSINADPEHFLHWDKPLSEQSPKVQEFFKNAKTEAPLYPDTPGQALPAFLSPDTRVATEKMRNAGIPGIKYLDQGSRNVGMMKPEPHEFLNGEKGWVVNGPKGDVKFDTINEANNYIKQFDKGQTHNYVVFDDSLISILKKYGLAGLVAGGASHFATTPVEHDPFAGDQ